MQVPQSVIEQLNEKADLVSIIKRHTDLKPSNGEFKGCCPFHGEKTPSFFVNPDSNLYYCFGCGAKGNAISFLVDYERMSFMEALQELSQRTGIDLPKEDNKKYTYQKKSPNSHRQNAHISINNVNNGNANLNITHNSNIQTNAHQNFIQNNNGTNHQNIQHTANQNLYQQTKEYIDNQLDNGQTNNHQFNHQSLNDNFDNYQYDKDNVHNQSIYNNALETHQNYYNAPANKYQDDFAVHYGDNYFNHHNFNNGTHNTGFDNTLSNDTDGDLYQLLAAVGQYYETMLKQNPIAYRYFVNRGISDEMIAFFGLGYAPRDWQNLEKAFPNDIEGLRLLGLVRTSQKGREFDLFRDRVMFPIKDRQGRIVGFAGRALDDETLPKYVNSSESVVFQKNHILYGYYESRKAKAKDWLVVEGYMDAIALYQAGIYGAVAPMGTAINEGQIGQLLKFNDTLTLCFDGDGAGQRAALRALEVAMPVLTDGKSLKFLTLPDNHDPDTYTKQYGKDKMQAAIDSALPISDYLYRIMANRYDLSRPEQKAAAMRDVRVLSDKLPKGSSFRSWLNSDFYYRLRGTTANQKTIHANYRTEQLTTIEELSLCLLFCPVLAQSICLDKTCPDDPLTHFLEQTELTNSHLPFESRLNAFNLITPLLPTWKTFCYKKQEVNDDSALSKPQLNDFGQLIVLLQSVLPNLLGVSDCPFWQKSEIIFANVLFIIGAMGESELATRLATHWQGFGDYLVYNELAYDNLSLLFNELLYYLTTAYIKNEQALTNHLLIAQLHKKRLGLLDDWLKRHLTTLDMMSGTPK